MKIMIIGGGNMGLTFARAFINAHVITPDQLLIMEKDISEKINLLTGYGLGEVITDHRRVSEAELIILAVKPQDALTLFSQIKDFIEPDQVILSIMAGITIDQIKSHLPSHKIIRAMPNLPSQIGSGMTAFTSTAEVSRLEEMWIQNLLQTTGKTLNVATERLIDASTAISGSGPAYIYYMMDAMIQAAVDMGIPSAQAELMVKQTFIGALHLFQQDSYSCQQWIDKVASKGGTTEAALKHFDTAKLDKIIAAGAFAAFDRAIELGK